MFFAFSVIDFMIITTIYLSCHLIVAHVWVNSDIDYVYWLLNNLINKKIGEIKYYIGKIYHVDVLTLSARGPSLYVIISLL